MLVGIKDANGSDRKLGYDRDGRLTSYTDCSGKTTQWKYSAQGQLAKLINAAGEATEYQYQAGQLTRVVLPDKTSERFEHDAEGRLLKHTDALHRRTIWTYNEAGRLKQRRNDDDSTLTYHWNKLGQLVRLRNENNAEAIFKYDAVGRLTRETGFDRETTDWLYDNGSQLPTRRIDGDRITHFEYDPMGRLLESNAGRRGGKAWETEKFSYDGNGNLLLAVNDACKLQWFYDEAGNNIREHQHFRYMKEQKVAVFKHEYDALNQRITFAYDALGRRLYKNSRSKYRDRPQAGPVWNENARRELDGRLGCGFTYYGWDGNTLAFECRDPDGTGPMTHYIFEPGTFVPIAQAVSKASLELIPQPVYQAPYNINRDPVWQHKPTPNPLDAFAWYQCDHLGTPMELTDEIGQVAWSGVYKAWGVAEEKRSEHAKWADIRNPLRFQGQYFDIETGLHYNRHRYYDPSIGRFIGKDPIGFSGGLNVYTYAANPIEWLDPLGLISNRDFRPTATLDKKLSALEGAQSRAVRERHLLDGRIRYYERESPARTQGPTRGRSHATEWNPKTGEVRSWEESYDHSGNVNRIHPKSKNGREMRLPHYPPTLADIEQGLAEPSKNCKCGD
ncbi:RHS repeat-associated core domain-containing protein [Pseudomonas asiatica]|uniref:RHS repeat-associated core domain-containing protein n=1 Tax=Pseudomonas asiatica TaxID=2219225 RepID=UPI0032EF1DCC